MSFGNLLEDAIVGTVGYAIGRREKSSAVRDAVNRDVETSTLAGLVERYAHAHGVYTRSHELAEELRRLADVYDDPYYR